MPNTTTRRTPGEKKYRRLLAQHARGASLDALAREHGVKRSTLVWWSSELRRRDRLRARSKDATFLPVRVAPAEPAPAALSAAESPGLEVLLATGDLLRVPPGFDADELRRLVSALRSAC